MLELLIHLIAGAFCDVEYYCSHNQNTSELVLKKGASNVHNP